MIELLIVALALWVTFNWLAPWTLLVRAEPMSLGRVSQDVAARAAQLGVRLYTQRLLRPGGFSVLAWPQRIVVFDSASLALTPAPALRFLIAHELGHCALGHVGERWLLVVSGAILLPVARRRLVAMEREADAYAEALTGVRADEFYVRR